MPRNMCALNTQPTSAKSSTPPARNVNMCCAQLASSTIIEPSKCWADRGMVASPSASCSHSSSRMTMSLVFEVARMRGSDRRRCSRIDRPTKPITPAIPPVTMAINCLAPVVIKISYMKCGVSMPTVCPNNRNNTPTWNRLLPQRRLPVRSSWDESLFQVYWSRSKRAQLPIKNTARQM